MKPSNLKWRCVAITALASLATGAALVPAASAADHGAAIERQDWTFAGFTGQYDRAQLQRGFQVTAPGQAGRQVALCHRQLIRCNACLACKKLYL